MWGTGVSHVRKNGDFLFQEYSRVTKFICDPSLLSWPSLLSLPFS